MSERVNQEYGRQFRSALSGITCGRLEDAQERARLEHELRMARRRIDELEKERDARICQRLAAKAQDNEFDFAAAGTLEDAAAIRGQGDAD